MPEGITVFGFPKAQQRRLRTVNLLERVNRELDRRTRVVSIFPSKSACLRLVSAVLIEIDEDRQTGRVYLRLSAEGAPPASSWRLWKCGQCSSAHISTTEVVKVQSSLPKAQT